MRGVRDVVESACWCVSPWCMCDSARRCMNPHDDCVTQREGYVNPLDDSATQQGECTSPHAACATQREGCVNPQDRFVNLCDRCMNL